MVLKLVAWRAAYFQTKLDICDCLVATTGVIDKWIIPQIYTHTTAESVLSLIRIFRLLRLLKMIRVLTIHRQLLIVCEGIAASLSSMFWVGVLLGLIIYASAILCCTTIGKDPVFQKHFGHLFAAMLSLFNMVLLDEWSVLVRPVAQKYPYAVPLFIVFVIFTACGVVNVIIGIIVESTNDAAARFRNANHQAKMEHKMRLVQALSDVMKELDTDGDDHLSREELVLAVGHHAFHGLIGELELPKGFSIEDMFVLLDVESTGKITHQEFVDGMFRMVHNSPFQQMCMVQLQLSQVKSKIKQLHQEIRHDMNVGFTRILEELKESNGSDKRVSDSCAKQQEVLIQENTCCISSPDSSSIQTDQISRIGDILDQMLNSPSPRLGEPIPSVTSHHMGPTHLGTEPLRSDGDRPLSTSIRYAPSIQRCGLNLDDATEEWRATLSPIAKTVEVGVHRHCDNHDSMSQESSGNRAAFDGPRKLEWRPMESTGDVDIAEEAGEGIILPFTVDRQRERYHECRPQPPLNLGNDTPLD